MRTRLKRWLGFFLILFFSLILVWFCYSYFTHGIVYASFTGDFQTLSQKINSFGFFSYILFVLLIIFECIFAPFPPLVLYIVGGIIFGGFLSGTLALIGNLIGAGIAFQIARTYGRPWVKRKIPKRINEKVDGFSKKYGGFSIFLLRLNPFTSSDLFSYAAGLTNMKRSKFLLGTILGLIPTIYLQTYLGQEIGKNVLFTKISLILGALYFVFFFILYFYLRKKQS